MTDTQASSSPDCQRGHRGRLAILGGTIAAGALGVAAVLGAPLVLAATAVEYAVMLAL